MAHKIENRVAELSVTVGVGPLVLTPASGYVRFSESMAIGDTCWYSVDAIDPATGDTSAFEYGEATYTAANTLTRSKVKKSTSGAGVAHPFGAGRKRVAMTILAPDAETALQWRTILGLEIVVDPALPDFAASFAAVNASALNMRTKTAQLAS